MNILECLLYVQDVEKVQKSVININKLRKKRILITGATGLVCSAITDILLLSDLEVKVYVAGRSEEVVRNRFGDKANFVQYDAMKPIQIKDKVDYIIHGASNASPNLYVEEPVETMRVNMLGVDNLLDYARKCNTENFILVSSSEIYGMKNDDKPFMEDQYGYIDLLNPRSSYAVSKRAAETLCNSYSSEYGIKFNIVRLGHIYGPTMSLKDKRVSSFFAYQAVKGNNLVLKSLGEQIRSYCYCLDCASAILSVMLNGINGEAYNISNRQSIISIRQMAEYYAKFGNVKLIIDALSMDDGRAFNPMNNSSLDSSKLEKLGWRNSFDVEEGFKHTIDILKEIL